MKRILAAALIAMAPSVGCSGPEETAPPEVVSEVAVVEEVAPEPRRSGKERRERAEAQQEFATGFQLLWGQAGVRDAKQAHVHLLRAAELGNARAQGIVGTNYEKGRGVERDMGEAIRWWTIASEQGWAHAQLKLGEAYRDGRGVEQDPVEALKWLALSGRGGSVAGKIIASSYAAGLSREQRQEGLERVRDWRIAHGLSVRARKPDAEAAGAPEETLPDAGA